MSNPLFDSEEMKFGEPMRCGEFVAGGDPLAYLLSVMASRLSLSILEVDENHHDTVLFDGARPFIASDYQLNSPLAAILRNNPRAVISYVEEDQFRVGYVGKLFTVEEMLRVIVDSVDLNLEVSPDSSVDFDPADFSFNAFKHRYEQGLLRSLNHFGVYDGRFAQDADYAATYFPKETMEYLQFSSWPAVQFATTSARNAFSMPGFTKGTITRYPSGVFITEAAHNLGADVNFHNRLAKFFLENNDPMVTAKLPFGVRSPVRLLDSSLIPPGFLDGTNSLFVPSDTPEASMQLMKMIAEGLMLETPVELLQEHAKKSFGGGSFADMTVEIIMRKLAAAHQSLS